MESHLCIQLRLYGVAKQFGELRRMWICFPRQCATDANRAAFANTVSEGRQVSDRLGPELPARTEIQVYPTRWAIGVVNELASQRL